MSRFLLFSFAKSLKKEQIRRKTYKILVFFLELPENMSIIAATGKSYKMEYNIT